MTVKSCENSEEKVNFSEKMKIGQKMKKNAMSEIIDQRPGSWFLHLGTGSCRLAVVVKWLEKWQDHHISQKIFVRLQPVTKTWQNYNFNRFPFYWMKETVLIGLSYPEID